MITLYLSSADDTRGVAGAIAPLLRAGDVVSLAGEMGAGKTFFVQALARALGIDEPVTSPTFNLVHTYHGAKFPLHHADLYRLERTGELADLGLDELAAHGGVVFVEWGNVARGDLGAGLEITIEQHDSDPDARTITIDWIGPRWESRWDQLRSAVAYWGRS
jgi:tRNA threonylcarbamoyladenosine biosynthesis protein TsaE